MEFQQVGGNTWGAETFLSSLFRAMRSKSNITGKTFARYTFCESLYQEHAWITKSEKSGFRFDPKYPPRVWILWIHDPFFDFAKKNAKSVFGFKNPFSGFPKETHPKSQYV